MNILEQINGWFISISSVFTAVGGLITWILMRKHVISKDISLNRKETKINNVDGDTALMNQLDLLLTKVTVLSETVIEVQSQLSALQNKELSYKSAFHRLMLLCDEVCTDASFCKNRIQQVLHDLKLNDDFKSNDEHK